MLRWKNAKLREPGHKVFDVYANARACMCVWIWCCRKGPFRLDKHFSARVMFNENVVGIVLTAQVCARCTYRERDDRKFCKWQIARLKMREMGLTFLSLVRVFRRGARGPWLTNTLLRHTHTHKTLLNGKNICACSYIYLFWDKNCKIC